MFTLGIETTCDETAAAIVKDGQEILSNVVASQIDLHAPWGGVFPELACRRHIDTLIPIIDEALKQAQMSPADLDLISVAKGPGLIGALLIGLMSAKSLSLAWDKPFIGVNHVEAHLYAAIMGVKEIPLPALGVVISGGHTFLVRIDQIGSYTLIGTTVDDAIGEAFDKVAAMLGLPYPGGPAIEALARLGDKSLFSFQPGRVKANPWDFSFSGLKTSVLYAIRGQNGQKNAPSQIAEEQKKDIAAAFQETALGDVVNRAIKAAAHFGCRSIVIGGGVSNNLRLRTLFEERAGPLPLYFPALNLSLDNAAMIAGLGTHQFRSRGVGDSLDLQPQTRIPLPQS
jgi:N6-L-threonylcarbamoyladenine synthase